MSAYQVTLTQFGYTVPSGTIMCNLKVTIHEGYQWRQHLTYMMLTPSWVVWDTWPSCPRSEPVPHFILVTAPVY